jgi:hypothetical protein
MADHQQKGRDYSRPFAGKRLLLGGLIELQHAFLEDIQALA